MALAEKSFRFGQSRLSLIYEEFKLAHGASARTIDFYDENAPALIETLTRSGIPRLGPWRVDADDGGAGRRGSGE